MLFINMLSLHRRPLVKRRSGSSMQTRVWSSTILSAALLLTLAPGNLTAQTREPSSQAVSQQPSSVTPQQTPSPAHNELPTVYGLQGVLIETLDGRTVSSQSVDQPLNPASAIKLATAFVALKN